MLTRRTLIEAAGAAVVSAFAIKPSSAAAPSPTSTSALAPATLPRAAAATGRSFCFFSKHLSDMSVPDLAVAVKDMGYDGIDLTVRSKGHVLPEKVTEDLPRALDTIHAKGSSIRMITTELTSASDPTARPIMQAASKAGIKLVKPGYWRYQLKDVRAEVASMAKDVAALAALAKEHGVELGVHNHTGMIGGGIWDLAPHMDTLDPHAVGYYFDVRHAVVEGGGVGWKTATLLAAPRLKMLAVKDFYWEKDAKTQAWKIKSCPIGEGMVDWPWYATTIAHANYAGPISVHFEYEIPGATPKEKQDNTIIAGKRDLAFIRRQFEEVRS